MSRTAVVTTTAGRRYVCQMPDNGKVIGENTITDARTLMENIQAGNDGSIRRNMILLPLDVHEGPTNLQVDVAEASFPEGEALENVKGLIEAAEQMEVASKALKSGIHIPNKEIVTGK